MEELQYKNHLLFNQADLRQRFAQLWTYMIFSLQFYLALSEMKNLNETVTDKRWNISCQIRNAVVLALLNITHPSVTNRKQNQREDVLNYDLTQLLLPIYNARLKEGYLYKLLVCILCTLRTLVVGEVANRRKLINMKWYNTKKGERIKLSYLPMTYAQLVNEKSL